jgi:dual specificity phosphatase 12
MPNINGYDANAADEIIPGLWLGSRYAALDQKWLGEKNIKSVFNCTKDIPYVETIQRKYRVPVDDNLQPVEIRNLGFWSYEVVFKMIREYQTGQPMLVHCAAGMQRSAACVAMFLIATKGLTPDEAVKYIQDRRPIAFRPFVNFKDSIQHFYDTYQKDIVPNMVMASTFR